MPGRGRLRVYLGAAPGVGKTFAMLNEGRRRRERGTDVVVAWVETHGRSETAAQLADLEVVPRAVIRYRDTELEELDLDAVLRRRPEVALVDELAHTNCPGSINGKRWQDVHDLLANGIDVVTTLNVQHLESLNDVVASITGVQQQETIPDEIVRAAEQIELVDMTAEALRRRMAHGNIYRPDRIEAALANYFRPGNLTALRELALLWVADRVDEALAEYRSEHGIAARWETRERVVVGLTGRPGNHEIIRRAARMAQRAHGELLGVHVSPADGRSAGDDSMLAHNRRLLVDVGGSYHELVAADPAAAVVGFARSANATQLVVGASQRSRWEQLVRGSFVSDLVRASDGIDVHVISARLATAGPVRSRLGHTSGARLDRRRDLAVLPARRRHIGWAIAAAGNAAMTVFLATTEGSFDASSRLLLFQLVILAAAAVGGTGPAVAASIVAAAALNWFFTPPIHTWVIGRPSDLTALVIFLVLGSAVGLLVTALASRTAEATRRRVEAETLARVAGDIASLDDPVPAILERLVSWLGLEAARVENESGVLATTGVWKDGRRTQAVDTPEGRLVVAGDLDHDDRRVLVVFGSQLSSALEQRRLREDAAQQEVVARADALRVALLRAVSHDLRSPLAAIKAAVTSMQHDDVEFSPDDRFQLLDTIDSETDRLDRVVANLLDASRLEAGALTVGLVPIALDELVPSVLRSTGLGSAGIELDLPTDVPLVEVDPGLLERVLANLLSNALRACPDGEVRIEARPSGGQQVELRVIDHGPGVAPPLRALMFEPFQRLGDHSSSDGIGLGLAVVKGLVEAMGGSVVSQDTPGGGLTMVVCLCRSN